jgi:hypothetical protein
LPKSVTEAMIANAHAIMRSPALFCMLSKRRRAILVPLPLWKKDRLVEV